MRTRRAPTPELRSHRPLPITLALAAALIGCAQPGRVSPGSMVSEAPAPARATQAAAAEPSRQTQAAPALHSPPQAPSQAARGAPPPAGISADHVDFATQVRPILQARCQPCHFPGGKVYAGLPFDRPATILELGEKLFTRIKDESQRRTIREFLAQPAASSANATARPPAGS